MSHKIVFIVTREGLGYMDGADRAFGVEMFDRFLHSLENQPVKPQAICFYTEGVKLVSQDSTIALSLRLLHGMGVRIVACRTCLEHFGLIDKPVVGEIAGMNDILSLMTEAEKVIPV